METQFTPSGGRLIIVGMGYHFHWKALLKSKDLEHFLFINSQLSKMMKLRVTNYFKENLGVPFIIAFDDNAHVMHFQV